MKSLRLGGGIRLGQQCALLCGLYTLAKDGDADIARKSHDGADGRSAVSVDCGFVDERLGRLDRD